MARSDEAFDRTVGRWSTRVLAGGIGTLLLSGVALAQTTQPAPSGPSPVVLLGAAAGGAFLGALVANVVWKVATSDDSDSATTPAATGAATPASQSASATGWWGPAAPAGNPGGGQQGRGPQN